ncbi:hypothetical protein [Halodesulfurarchaeum formicicum]|uniref:hypothetical protein n=1 Tax=Halodesulfurarchaeum formicicum TaxID=1873524 RepID=UPI0012FE2877|nr:hypothetical protein [Halodesulfurarchaeum formicicum]
MTKATGPNLEDMRRPVGVSVLVLLLVGSLVVAPVGASTTAAGTDQATQPALTASEDEIVRTFTFSLTPEEPGVVDVRLQFAVPDQVFELETSVPERATVTDTNGFSADGTGNYTWDGETTSPSISLALEANQTGQYHYKPSRAEPDTERGLMFVDTGDWALVSVPGTSVWWRYRGTTRPSFETRTEVAGSGMAGDRMVYLGPHSTTTRDIGDQTVSLVVPDAATLESDPESILDTIEAGERALPPSPVERSLLIAAPTSVEWGPYGLAQQTDAWVRADQSISDPNNVWVHEFVHLRQDFETTTDTRWIREAMPEYYAAALTLDQGRIDFETFAEHLERGTNARYDETVLSQPDTWGSLANYVKGALVYGTIDYRIRATSDRTRSARHLFAAMNAHDGPIDQAYLDAELAELGGKSVAAELDRFITTTRTPSMWSAQDHETAFGASPPVFVTNVNGPIEITGPYRNTSITGSIPTLVPGERITIPVTITNDGGTTGAYAVPLTVDGVPVANATGTLDSGENANQRLSYTVEQPGRIQLAVGTRSWTAEVAEPETPEVMDLWATPATIRPGESVTLTLSIANPGEWPATGTVTPRLDGTALEPIDLDLAVNETAERTQQITLDGTGEHTVTAGDRSITINVVEPTETRHTTPTQTPGFTAAAGVIAALFAGLIAGQRDW